MPNDVLTQLLAVGGADLAHLGPEELADVARRLTLAPPDEFVLAAARAPGLDWQGAQGPADYFQIHDRDWWIDASHQGNRDRLGLLVVAAALVDALRLPSTLEWTAALLPALVSVESATADAAGVHLTLRRRPGAVLPAELADEVHPQDFADLAKAVAEAGSTMALPAGGTLTFAA
jgi:hypothetical protein